MLWGKKQTPIHDRSRTVGIDLNASRVRAVSVGGGKYRSIVLEDPSEELMLFIACDRRTPDTGRAGYSLCRRLPHVVCSNFLPSLARSMEWNAGRHTLTAEAALGLALEKVRGPIADESEAAVLVLPAYLAPDQVSRAVLTATRTKMPLKGTASAPLALAASRATVVLNGKPVNPTPKDGVVPLRPLPGAPGSVVIVDADEYALSASVIEVSRDAVKLVAVAAWPRLAIRAWKDKLLDAVADRCIRLCRRDPRDSADAEQTLYEQLDDALDRARAGQRVNLTVRTDHWYQDVVHAPDDFDGYCSNLARSAAESVRELVNGTNLLNPPRAVWLTHDAGRLPGLEKVLHENTPEGTTIETLAPPAVAVAAASLAPRWLAGELPRTHLDTSIPVSIASSQFTAKQITDTR